MKRNIIIWVVLICCVSISCKNCKTTPILKGDILFWTSNSTIFSSCGSLTIVLGNGKEDNITGFYNPSPQNCENIYGGFFNLNAGNYTYSVITGNGCNISGGSFTVIGNQCNMVRIQ